MDFDTKRKLLSALAHGSIFFSALVVSIGIPIALLFVADDSVIKENAKESLNFHFNLWLYGVIFGVLAFFLIGIPLLWLLGIINVVMPIIAIVKVVNNPAQPFRYPFIFRVV
ncbi:MAG: DUF4870 domain-containing protein [Chroococcales cyanobacterium]